MLEMLSLPLPGSTAARISHLPTAKVGGEKVKERRACERSCERFVNVPPWEIEVLLYAFLVSDEAPDAA